MVYSLKKEDCKTGYKNNSLCLGYMESTFNVKIQIS